VTGPGSPAGSAHRAGFVALVGLPNVGKSTLLNRILGRKLAIVTPKPQTTRTRILGIETRPGAQFLFVDTPGIHRPRNLLGERMVRAAEQSLAEADVGLWVVDAGAGIRPEEEELAGRLASGAKVVVVALNQIDRVKSHALLPLADRLGALLAGRHVVPVSARTGENLEELLRTVEAELPESPPLYPEDAQTDLPEKFFAAEIVREQVLLATEQEVPYQSAVTIESFTERPEKNLLVIAAQIRVARASQKPIVIGGKGARIKEIGQRARAELERFFGVRVYLELFVKVDSRWFERAASLAELGL
jgi:GTP-binding protein Era